MTIKKWFKDTWTNNKENFKNVWGTVKFMYKDKVDLAMHLLIVAIFIWGFVSDQVNMMAAVGFFGVYAFGATYRQAYWKKKWKEDVYDKLSEEEKRKI